MEIFLTIIVVLAAGLLAIVAMQLRKRRVSGLERQRILSLWKALDVIDNPAMRIMQADIVLHQALKTAGYNGTTGEMLKQSGARLSDENAVWRAHKLRNNIAHEPGLNVSDKQTAAAMKSFRKAINDLI